MRDAGWSKELDGPQLEEELSEALAAARAWMEIAPENPEGKPSGTLQVGETALLTIKSTLPGKWYITHINSKSFSFVLFCGEGIFWQTITFCRSFYQCLLL